MSNAHDLLRRALKDLEEGLRPIRKVELIDEIRTYLATADAAEEPIAWIPEDELPERYPYNFMFQYSKVDIIRWFPIYGPPKPEPMTKEEIDSKFALDGSMFSSYTAFKQGVRFAEKYHGIGTIQCGKDDSTMQSMCRGDKGMPDLAIWRPSACCSFRWVERPKTKPRGNEPGYATIIEKVLQQLYVNTLKPEYKWRDVPTVKEDEE